MSLSALSRLSIVMCLLAAAPLHAGQNGKSASPAAATKIYKWVDEQGVMHYGTSIPPQYANKAVSELNRSGVEVKRISATPSDAERKAEEEKAEQAKELQKRLAEQKRRDTALLSTYTSAKEIDDAKERNLALPKQAIVSLQPRLQRAQERLAKLEGQVEKVKSAGRTPPDTLLEDVAGQQSELAAARAEIERHNAQIEQIRKRFDQDKQRYFELTQR